MVSVARRRDKTGGWCGDQLIRGLRANFRSFHSPRRWRERTGWDKILSPQGFLVFARECLMKTTCKYGCFRGFERAGRGEKCRIFFTVFFSLRGVYLSKSQGGGSERSLENVVFPIRLYVSSFYFYFYFSHSLLSGALRAR